MSQSGIITLPMLRGPLVASGPWQSLLAQPNKRIYPFPTGSIVSVTSTGTTLAMHGLGEPIAVNDYIIVCTETSYGNSSMYIPDFSKIRLVSAVSGSEDEITVAAVSVTKGDYILNIGADGAAAPASDPDLDAIVTLYDDLAGDATNSNGYLLTGTGGHFRGWLPTSTVLVDLLITDNSKNPEVVIPFFTPGTEA